MNEKIFYFFYNLSNKSPLFDEAVVFFAVYFPFVVVVMAMLYLYIYKKSSWNTFFVLGAAGVGWFLAHVLKILFATSRPFDALPGVTSLFTQTSGAFPSGHATFFAALGFSIFFLYKKAGSLFIFFAVLIGLARIMAGVHFPVDIAGGFVLGLLVALGVSKLAPKIRTYIERR